MDDKNIYLLRDDLVPTDTIATAAAKASPPAAVTFIHWFLGVPIEKWVMTATLLYTCLQIGFLISDRLRKRRSKFRMRKTD